MLTDRMREVLPKLTLEGLAQINNGRVGARFQQLIADACRHISQFPCKDGKPEPREITIRVQLIPVVKPALRPVETAGGTREIEVPELNSITTKIGVYEKFPRWESGCVNLAIDVRGSNIVDVRFNPTNDINPEQLELFDESAE